MEAGDALYEEEEETAPGYDFEPLPALLEDEENVSLADILSLRDSCLTEQDIWAICLECSHSLKSVAHSAIFQTLCITPDTLAFNTNGNVCFMEQLSDDPEGAFVPPEFDITGNTFEAHIYSLGTTLKAAIEYVIEPGTESDFGKDLQTLLEQMQEENPEDRPDIESIISLCEEKLKLASSSNICRSLSAIGRRVLSIESFGASQDGCDNMWKGKVYQRSLGSKLYSDEKTSIAGDSYTVEDVTASCCRNASIENVSDQEDGSKVIHLGLNNEKSQHSKTATQVKKSKEDDKYVIYEESFADIILDTQPCTIDVERDVFKKSCLRKMKTFPKLPLNATDANNFFTSITNNGPVAKKNQSLAQESLFVDNNNEVVPLEGKLTQFNTKNLPRIKPKNHQVTDLPLEASCICAQVSGMNLDEHTPFLNSKKKTFLSSSHTLEFSYATSETPNTPGTLKNPDQSAAGAKTDNYMALEDSTETSQGSNQNYLPHFNKMDSVLATNPSGNEYGSSLISSPVISNGMMSANNNEDNLCGGSVSEIKSNEQWLSLKLLLSWHGKPLKDYELWALCHECLLALQTCTDYPACLCLDSVLIDCHGNILFAPPKDEGSYDAFYLAPEIDEEDIDEEKVCIYGTAAVLWMAAKCSFPPDHKLVLPRKLKNLLLDMAKKNPEERPSLADAIKTSSNYLCERGINSKKVLALLSKSVFKVFKEEVDSFQEFVPLELKNKRYQMDASESILGFVPITRESKLIAVKGPVPCQISLNSETTTLPVAFTSSATHFKPIILQQNTDLTKETLASTSEELEKEVKEEMQIDTNKSVFVGGIGNNVTEAAVVAAFPEIPEPDLEILSSSSQVFSKKQNPSNISTSTIKLPLPSGSSCSLQENNTLSAVSSSSSSCSTPSNTPCKNKFLLEQDFETRVLTLVPVHLAVSEQIPNKPLQSKIAYDCYHSLPVLLSSTVAHYKTDINLEKNSSLYKPQNCEPSNLQNKHEKMKANINGLSLSTTNQIIEASRQEHKEYTTNVENSSSLPGHTSCASVNQNSTCLFDVEVLSQQNKTEDTLLQKAVHLIQEEFAFDGYLENGAEVFAMGNYILTLKDLKFEIFCDAISEKFCDLYWDEKLLENLYKAVHGKATPPLSTTETDYSKCGHMFQHLKTDSFLASSRQTKGKEKQVAFDTGIVPVTNISPAEMDLDELSPDNFEKEPNLKKVILKIGTEGECLQSNGHSFSPYLAEENIEEEEKTTIKAAENTYPIPPNLTDFNSWNPGWSSAFYGAECYNSEVYNYVKKLGKQKVNDSQNIEAKKVELEQLLMIETKNYRKTIQFYQKLLQKERRNKDSEIKTKLLKLKGELQEMKSKVQFLETVKKYLQIMCAEQWGMESCDLTTVINIRRTEMMDVTPLNEESLLIFYNMQKSQYNNQNQSRILQAGTPLGLMAYLYSRNAILEGYVQQFLYTFRYFCTQEEFLQFLLDTISSTLSSANLDPSSPLTKIYNRSCYILWAWIEDCYRIDFATNANLLCKLKDFITSKITPLNSYGECLLSLLEDATGKKHGNALSCYNVDRCKGEEDDDRKSLHSLCKKLSEDVSRKSFNWKLSKGNGPIVRHQRERPYTISSALPKPCYNSFTEEFSSTYAKAYDRGLYLLAEYSTQQLCCQLTLLQQEMFHKCHPVHFLNSRALGVKEKCVSVQKVVSTESVSHNVYNLFLANCVQDKYLLQLLRNSDNISTWVAAEIVTCHTSKLQMNLLSKFLLIAKSCYEQRNFATAMQILVGLENLMVRQLPAWKILPSKISEIMEELKAVEVFLKSDSLCLMEGERFKTLPTIPSARVLAMHVQQLETGGFIMANGSQKWTKLRNIAKVVSQVHAFQENPYTFTPDLKLQAYLRKRIDHFSDADISTLAADNCANFHQIPADKHSRKIQDTLRRMKATFQ